MIKLNSFSVKDIEVNISMELNELRIIKIYVEHIRDTINHSFNEDFYMKTIANLEKIIKEVESNA